MKIQASSLGSSFRSAYWLLAVTGLGLSLAAVASAPAATLTWDSDATFSNGVTDGSGTWNMGTGATANWDNGTTDVVWTNGNNAVFGANGTSNTTPYTVTLSGGAFTFGGTTAANATGITFNVGGYTLASNTTSDSITFSGGSSTGYFTTNADATITAVIKAGNTAGATYIKNGSGTLTLSGSNTGGSTSGNSFVYANVQAGTLLLNRTTSPAVSGIADIASGAIVQIGAGSTTNQLSPSAGNGLVINSGGTFDLNGATQLIYTLNGANGTSTGSTVGTITNTAAAAGTLTVKNGGSFAGLLTDGTNGGSLAIGVSAGTLTLTNANTYSGGTTIVGTIAAGVDTIVTSGAITSGALGTGTITFSGGGTLVSTGAAGTTRTLANPITITGTNLTASVGSSTTGNLALGSVAANGGGTSGTTLAVNNAQTSVTTITSSAPFQKSGTGILALVGVASYSSATIINAGTFSINNDASTTSGQLSGTSSITLNAAGNGTLLLSGATSVTDRISNGAKIVLAGGTLNLGGVSEGGPGTTPGVGALTLSATSTLDFGTTGTSNVINFNGSTITHTQGAGVLTVTDYENGSDHLYFTGNDTTFSNAFAPSDVSIDGVSGYTLVQDSGYFEVEVASVPEPGTMASGLCVVGLLGFHQRRRLAGRWLVRGRKAA